MGIMGWKTRGPIAAGLIAGVLMMGASAAPTRAQDSATYDRDALVQRLRPITGEDGTGKVDLYLAFGFDSDELLPEAQLQLDLLAAAMTSDALITSRFGIYGHTDASGSSGYNLYLSRRRASAVRDYLVAQSVDPARLEVDGFGESQLKNPLAPRAGENRRVEIINLTPPLQKGDGPQAITGEPN